MFDRVEYKKIAKRQLKGRWATPVLATAIILAIALVISAPSLVESIKNGDFNISSGEYGFRIWKTSNALDNSLGIIIIAIIGILELAYTRLFLDLWKTREPLPFADFLSAFSNWLQGMLAALWLYLWVFLWSLLFFIPGIVKAYAYSQMFFILAENPKIGVRKAMKLSIEITRGYKGDLFMMDMSFLGWMLLACLTGSILNLYVMPYMQMSKTNAYKMLKAMALRSGRVSAEDFGNLPENAEYESGAENSSYKTPASGTQAQDAYQQAQADSPAVTPDSSIQMPGQDPQVQENIPDVINLPSSYDDGGNNMNNKQEGE